MLKYRAISFPLLMALLGVIFFSPFKISVWIFLFCATAAIGLAAYECARMVNSGLAPCFPKTAGVLTAILIFSLVTMLAANEISREIARKTCGWGYYQRWRNLSHLLSLLKIIIIAICALLPWLAVVFGNAERAKKGFATSAVVFMTAIPFCMVALLYFPDPKYLFFVMMVTKAMDTGGYVFGMLSGKYLPGGNHKLCPSISPKKSWEGFAGGVLLAMLTAWVLRAVYRICDLSYYPTQISLWKILVFAILLALASICGDLTESALKRKCGVKDSGHLIPGMGGPLDVLDSFIYVGPVCVIYEEVILKIL